MQTVNHEDPLPESLVSDTAIFLDGNFDILSISFEERDTIRNHTPTDVEISVSQKGAPSLSYKGVPIHDSVDPIDKAKRQVDQIDAEDGTSLVIIMGFGLGYHAEYLERRFTCPIIVYEPNLDIATATLSQRPLPLKRTIVCTEIPLLLVHTQARLQFTDRKIVVAAIKEYQHLFPEIFSKFKQSVYQAIANAQILENTTAIRSMDWIYHAAKNIPKAADKPTIECLGDRFQNRPGILISAGPSLDTNIHQLKAMQGHALLMAVNAAAKPLEQAGIKPDIIAVVEGLDLRAQLEGISWLKDTILAPTLNCFPGFFDLEAKYLFPIADFSIAASDWFSKAYKWHQMPSGGSVACTAFSMLYSLGCDPIILVGQDLAYTQGQSYAKSATFGSQAMRFDSNSNRLQMVETERNTTIETLRKEGGLALLDSMEALEVDAWGLEDKVYTVPMFNLFNTWFETAANGWAKDRILINATEGGAHINGFEEIPLEKAIETHCTIPIDKEQLIDDAVLNAPLNDLNALIEAIEEDLGTISDLRDLSRIGIQSATSAIDILDGGNMAEADYELRRLSSIENSIRARSRESRTIDAFISGKINKLRLERWQDRDENRIRQSQKALKRAIALFEVIQTGADELLALYRPVIKEILTKMG